MSQRRFIVQRFDGRQPEGTTWVDVVVLDADDPGSALQQAFVSPGHQIQTTTYRVAEEALTVNVSINLEQVGPLPSRGGTGGAPS